MYGITVILQTILILYSEEIPREYFFKVREPQIRRRREIEAKAKKAAKENQVLDL